MENHQNMQTCENQQLNTRKSCRENNEKKPCDFFIKFPTVFFTYTDPVAPPRVWTTGLRLSKRAPSQRATNQTVDDLFP